jgi:hypothetical protein
MNDEQKYLLIKSERSLNAAKGLNNNNYPEFANPNS